MGIAGTLFLRYKSRKQVARLDSEQVSNDSCYSHTGLPCESRVHARDRLCNGRCLIQTLPALHLGVNVMEGV
jgi:hypothetical protein